MRNIQKWKTPVWQGDSVGRIVGQGVKKKKKVEGTFRTEMIGLLLGVWEEGGEGREGRKL